MSTTTPKTAFWRGVRDSAPFTLVAAPFALLFGVIATEAGLNLFEVMISALAVNLRVAMYSAALTPYLGRAPMWQRAFAAYLLVDQSYALSHQKFEAEPAMTVPERMGYYMGTCLLVMSVWYGASLAGAIIGSALPPQIPIDFALPIAFLAMVAPALRTLPHVIAAFTAVVVSLFAAAVPWSLGLIIAGAAGMIAGAQAELWMERRR